jgi:hypothetical protein
MDQGAAYGNEFERHRSLWKVDELQALGFELLDDGTTDGFGNQMLLGVAVNWPATGPRRTLVA